MLRFNPPPIKYPRPLNFKPDKSAVPVRGPYEISPFEVVSFE
ncbi:MAG: hypothetical protein WAO32_08550 [Defluviitoga tunisiensis]|jgi:hypothetical protein